MVNYILHDDDYTVYYMGMGMCMCMGMGMGMCMGMCMDMPGFASLLST